jgi:hypothetical protein
MDDLYVLTSQVDQVYYVEDESNLDWACVIKTKPRNVYDVGQGEGLMMQVSTTTRLRDSS